MAGASDLTTERNRQSRRRFLTRLSLGHVIMIVAGLAAFLLVFSLLRARDEVFEIAVAAAELRAGAVVTADSFRWEEVGATGRNLLGSLLGPDDAAAAVAENWVVTRTISTGDPVRKSDFRTEATPSHLRAMSIPIDAGHAVGGALRVGDVIDVIVVRKGVASYVATGIEILDVKTEEARFGTGFSVTVGVDGPTSLRVASAIREGALEIVRATGARGVDPEDRFEPRDEPASGVVEAGNG